MHVSFSVIQYNVSKNKFQRPIHFKHRSHRGVIYLLAVTLSLLPAADRVKCRNKFSRAVSKVLTAGHW